jgi:acyl transferase domain-containing protein/acyl carrier protein
MRDSDENLYDIAIIGLAGRFPGARNVDEFWQNLRGGVESISHFSDEELKAAGVDAALLSDARYVKARGVLEDTDLFDASFFGFSPHEAELTNPQHRLLLECAWETLEVAGYDPEAYSGSIGVFAGLSSNAYILNLYANRSVADPAGAFQFIIGNDKDHAPTRVSYLLNLRGPSMNVQTACSSSLVAVYLACQSLLGRQCDMALAGGASVSDVQKAGYWYVEGGIKSPDGHCRAFDAGAQGTVGGSGLGLVLLKRMADALADGDCIHAVIKGAATNNDGAARVGYTAPSVNGQAEVIAEALAVAGVDAETIGYVEAHGTGTPLGDPIEVAALTQAFSMSARARGFCAIGSVKTNIGHLDAAAGVAGLIKAILALKHKEIPPSLHFSSPNPRIDFANSPFYVNQSLSAWKRGATQRRASVSSFGMGGTNAHVILEEAPPQRPSPTGRLWHLLPLSARTEPALNAATANLSHYLQTHPDLNLADVAYTLQVGRRAFKHRCVFICQTLAGAVDALKTSESDATPAPAPESHQTPRIAFMFPGGGAQHAGMASGIYRSEPTFRKCVDQCLELLDPGAGAELRRLLKLHGDDSRQSERLSEELQKTSVALPALFITEYALARLWMSWGVKPDAMIGHSLGEYVAACLAGSLSLEDALGLVSLRGRLFEKLPHGVMLSVPLPESAVIPFLNDHLSLAAVNGPSLCVVSGALGAVEDLEARLKEAAVDCRRLHISVAAHSRLVTPILDEFAAFVSRIRPQEPQIPYVSNVTGAWVTASQATDTAYWVRHLRETVRFAEGLDELSRGGAQVFLEVGPSNTLCVLAGQALSQQPEKIVLPSLPHPQDSRSDTESMLSALGQLWMAGVKIDWPAFHAHERRFRAPLPTYPFERQRYWIERQPERPQRMSAYREPSGARKDLAEWFYLPYWKPEARLAVTANDNVFRRKGAWLLFLDECGLGAQLAARLSGLEQDAITVSAGAGFTRRGAGAYVIDPERREDYDRLFDELRNAGKAPEMILHLWGVTMKEDGRLNCACRAQFLHLSFYSLLYLAQSIGDAAPTRLSVISSNAQAVNGQETICPEKATTVGLCKVIPQEYLNVSCRSIDVVIPPAGKSTERLVERLLAEVTDEFSDPVVALRGNLRWLPAYEETRLDRVSAYSTRLRRQGVYLITGGLGGVGSLLAEYLARAVKARLILLGRSPLPPREQWEQWVKDRDRNDPVSRKIMQIWSLEEMGAEVLPVSADVTDEWRMKAAVDQAIERYGTINGVIHAAGVPFGGMIQRTTQEEAAGVLAPKVEGARVLETVFEGRRLDFMLLCSALNAALGAFGHAAYCAANLFLDAFAHYHTAKNGVPTISVNWDAWRGVGMAAGLSTGPELDEKREERFSHGILPEEGTDAFDRILSIGAAQVLVSTRDFHQLAARQKGLTAADSLDRLKKETLPARPRRPRPQLAEAFVAPRDESEERIADLWRQLLGIEPIGIHDNFFALGGHSLLAVQLIARARDAFDANLPLRSFFESPTVAGLAAALKAHNEGESDQLRRLDAILSEIEQLTGEERLSEALQETQRAE